MAETQGLGAKKLRGAMLGTGSISIHHMRAWQAIPNLEIVALANRTRERAVSLGSEFGIDDAHVYPDYQTLLDNEQLDFVDIATAPHIHREQVLAAAAHSVNVLCQKPFATSISEAREMIRACEAAGARCVVNENWRWRRWYRELKQLLTQETIGTPRYARFFSHTDNVLPRTDGTLPGLLVHQPYAAEMEHLILYEWGIHLVDVLRFLFGSIVRVYANTEHTSPIVRGEDRALVVLEFRNGVTGILDISWGSRTRESERLVRGNLDSLRVEGDTGTIELDPYQNDSFIITSAARTICRPARGELSPAEAYQESYFNTQNHFVEALRNGTPAENDARDNLETFAAVMAAYASAATHHVMDVNIEG
jgi:predicted dehydrogenase